MLEWQRLEFLKEEKHEITSIFLSLNKLLDFVKSKGLRGERVLKSIFKKLEMKEDELTV